MSHTKRVFTAELSEMIETLVLEVHWQQEIIAVVICYAIPQATKSQLNIALEKLLQKIKCGRVIIIGDMNFDLLKENSIPDILSSQGFTQHITTTTHRLG